MHRFVLMVKRCTMTDSLADRGNDRLLRVQVKGQVNISNLVIRRTIIVTVFGLWLLSHK